mgnify:CR=1 FL=1
MKTMKSKIYVFIACLFLTAGIWAQAPQKMSYQAVVRDAGEALIVSKPIGMQISILQGSSSGTVVYAETQTTNTNTNGLVSVEIGTGSVVTGNFTTIDWAAGPYFIKTETDPTGGNSYTITGTSELTSTPYALHATTAENGQSKGTATGQIQYWDGSVWKTLAPGSEGQVLTSISGIPAWTTLSNSGGAQIIDVVSPTGATWMDRNLGASQVATSSTDELAYGDMYQFGRLTDGHEKRTSGTTATRATSEVPGHGDFILAGNGNADINEDFNWHWPANDALWDGVNGANNPCPTGYRLPTEDEWEAERLSWSSNDAAGAFASPLKLTVGGRRDFDNSLSNVGTSGYYWATGVSQFATYNERRLFFSASGSSMGEYYRSRGIAVRCIKD